MGTSSARPDDLDRFVAKSRALDDELQGRADALRSLHNNFKANSTWGQFDASSLIVGFYNYIGYNGNDAAWVANIADSFRRAGGTGALSTLPDAAIAASLKAAGLWGTRQSVTFDDPIAYGFPPTTGYADDPVNTASGNFVERENDLPFAALVAGLRFTRTYNSRSDRVGAFGPGWSSWAEARLRVRPEGAEYIGPDGQRALIPRMGEGYGRVAGVDGFVEPTESGLVLRWFGGGSWTFEQAGLPVQMERGPGTEISFRHEEGRLVEMSHEGGKTVTLEWADDRVVALVSSDGRRVDYRYDADGNLIEAVSDAGPRRYEVDDVGRIVRVIDADGVVEVDNTFDDEGRVIEQLSRFGRRTKFSYLPGRVTVNDDDSEEPVTNTYIHDHAGRLIGLIDGHGNKLAKSYDDWGNPVAITERNGTTTVREWDDRSRLVRETRPGGEWFAFEYDDSDRVVRVEASNGAVTSYLYEGAERSPVEMLDPEGGVTRMQVEGGLVRAIRDPDGVELRFEFDSDGNVTGATDADGNHAVVERDAAGRALAAITPTGRRTEFAYDSHGRLVHRHDPGGATWAFEYSNAGRLIAVIDPLGSRQETRYGEHGEAEEIVDALGHISSRRYDEMGNLVGVVAPDGAKWELTYDGLCRLTSTHDPAGATWIREYDVTGNLIGTIDPVGTHYRAAYDGSGRVTGLDDGLTQATFEFDELGRARSHRRPDGSEMSATYDLCGRRTSVRDPGGGTTRYEYTPGGRLERMTSPMGRTISFEYDRCGRLAARVDGGGRRWTYSYAADGAPLEILGPGGGRERFSYDEAGRLSRRTTPGRGRTEYDYDLVGRVVSITSPATGTRRFTYDAAGRMVEATDANGSATRYTYNERGWVTEIEDALGGRMTPSYDEVGRVVSETDQLGRTTSYTYDPAGRLIMRVDGAGLKTHWRYDPSGRVRSFGAEQEPEVTIERDVLGRPVTITEPGLHHEMRWDSSGRLIERRRGEASLQWRYDADGYRDALVYPNGSETAYTYNDGGDLTALRHSTAGTFALERDPDGRLTALNAEGVEARWTYEDGSLVGYQIQAEGRSRDTRIERDESGRVASTTIDGAVSTYSYDPAGQLISVDVADGRSEFRYDANGRLVEEHSPSGTATYTYDAAGQLTERRRGPSVTRYEYDGGGRRTRETDGERTRTYTWDGLGRLAQVQTSEADLQRSTRLVVDALGELAQVNDTTLMWDTADPWSPLCSVEDAAVVSHGSSWALVGEAETQWLQPDWMSSMGEVDAWGEGASPPGEVGVGYRGELAVDCMVWLRNRVYDPSSRALLSPDPLPPPTGVAWAGNPYSYAGNDPIGSADPLGLRPVTEEQLANYRDAMNRSVWEQAGDWVQDNWEYIAAGAMIVAGIAVMATGVGGPIGVAMISGALLSAGGSTAIQKATTGKVNWGQVALDGALGAAVGGAGAWAGGLVSGGSRVATMSPWLKGAIGGGAENLVSGGLSRGLTGDEIFNPRAIAGDLLMGGAGGAVAGHLGRGRDALTSTTPPSTSTALVPYPDWPPHRGFLGGWTKEETLPAGTRLSRFGREEGTFVSPEHVPFEDRALPPDAAKGPRGVYQVVEPVTVDAGIAAPAFGGGGGVQYELPETVADLIRNGTLKAVE